MVARAYLLRSLSRDVGEPRLPPPYPETKRVCVCVCVCEHDDERATVSCPRQSLFSHFLLNTHTVTANTCHVRARCEADAMPIGHLISGRVWQVVGGGGGGCIPLLYPSGDRDRGITALVQVNFQFCSDSMGRHFCSVLF